MTTPSVLFVCLGNICRSPLAEAALRRAAAEAGIAAHVDSAGTADYHVGKSPDPRSIAEAARHGINISGYRGRQLSPEDFRRFDWIIGMDAANMRDIARMDPGDGIARVTLLLDLVEGRQGEDVIDPWYGQAPRFSETWNDVSAGAAALVRLLR